MTLSTAKNTQCHLHMSTGRWWNDTDSVNRSIDRGEECVPVPLCAQQ